MPRGGLRDTRTTSKPMPVSGPGALSQRTDMVPASATPTYSVSVPQQRQNNMATPVASVFAPDQYPDRPVTHGASVGPGFTPETPMASRFQMIQKYAPMLDTLAAQQDAPPAFQSFWNYVKAAAQQG